MKGLLGPAGPCHMAGTAKPVRFCLAAQRKKWAGFLAVGRLAAGQPPFEVGLAAGHEGQVLSGELFEEDHGSADALAHDRELSVGGVLAVDAAGQAPLQVQMA